MKGTDGESFHPDLVVAETDYVQKKGEQLNVDSYSGFFDNFKGVSECDTTVTTPPLSNRESARDVRQERVDNRDA